MYLSTSVHRCDVIWSVSSPAIRSTGTERSAGGVVVRSHRAVLGRVAGARFGVGEPCPSPVRGRPPYAAVGGALGAMFGGALLGYVRSGRAIQRLVATALSAAYPRGEAPRP